MFFPFGKSFRTPLNVVCDCAPNSSFHVNNIQNPFVDSTLLACDMYFVLCQTFDQDDDDDDLFKLTQKVQRCHSKEKQKKVQRCSFGTFRKERYRKICLSVSI